MANYIEAKVGVLFPSPIHVAINHGFIVNY